MSQEFGFILRLEKNMKTAGTEEFERLWNNVNSRVASYFFRNGCPEEDVKDLTQDVALRAYRSFGTQTGDFKSWIYTISKRVFVEYVKMKKREIRADSRVEAVNPNPNPDSNAVYKVLVGDCLRELDPKERVSLYYHDALGWKFEEIGEKLGISRSNAHYQVENARRKLREMYPDLVREYGSTK